MSDVVILDTSILLNVLSVPGRCRDREAVIEILDAYKESGDLLLLPWSVVVEAAGHILREANGNDRRRCANVLKALVLQAVANEAPWTMLAPPSGDELSGLMDGFPDSVMREVSLVDSDIVRAYERMCEEYQRRRVLIWSFDGHLQGYERAPLIR